jgi:Zn-dependent protease
MKQTMPLGRVAGIRIGAHWSALVMVVLIGWLLGAQVLPGLAPHEPAAAYWAVAVPGAVTFIAALLAHELAHSLVARRCGVPVTSITLWALGGVSELGGEPPHARADLLIAAAGPATSLAAGLAFGAIAAAVRAGGGPVIAVAALGWLAVMNVFLAVFNLLPGAPLDGGRILRAALWMRHGDRARATQTAATAGRVLGAVLMAAGAAELLLWGDAGGLWLAVIGMFVMSAATAEATAGSATTALAGLRAGDVMTPDPDIGATWLTVSDFIDRVAVGSARPSFPSSAPADHWPGSPASGDWPGCRRPAAASPRCSRSSPPSRPPTCPAPRIRPPPCSAGLR